MNETNQISLSKHWQCNSHSDVMSDLKKKIRQVEMRIPRDKSIVYIDYPMHPNIGDVLIHLGTERFFLEAGYKIAGRFSIYDFTVTNSESEGLVSWKDNVGGLDNIVRKGATIVLHGGGNLGDIYHNHQSFRELIVRRYPFAKIVILPQSVHFENLERKSEVADLFGSHKDLFIFARDSESLDFVTKDCGLPGEAMPDMAHMLWDSGDLRVPERNGGNPLYLWRQDAEGRTDAPNAQIHGAGRTIDWEELIGPIDWFLVKAIAKMQTLNMPPRWVFPSHLLWYPYRDVLLQRSLKIFDGVSEVCTDRLHGMILSSLLNIPVSFWDNSYGKLSRYHRLWLKDSDAVVAR